MENNQNKKAIQNEEMVNAQLKQATKIYIFVKALANVLSEFITCYTARSLGWQGTYFDPEQRASQDIWTRE